MDELVAGNIPDTRDFIRTWFHENAHREIERNYDSSYLEELYDSFEHENKGGIEDQLSEFYSGIDKAGSAGEILAYLVEKLHLAGIKSVGFSVATDIEQLKKVTKTNSDGFNGVLASVYNNIVNNKSYGRKNNHSRNSQKSFRRENNIDLQRDAFSVGSDQRNSGRERKRGGGIRTIEHRVWSAESRQGEGTGSESEGVYHM